MRSSAPAFLVLLWYQNFPFSLILLRRCGMGCTDKLCIVFSFSFSFSFFFLFCCFFYMARRFSRSETFFACESLTL